MGTKKKRNKREVKSPFSLFLFFSLGSQNGTAHVIIAMTGGPTRRVAIIGTIVQHIYIIFPGKKVNT